MYKSRIFFGLIFLLSLSSFYNILIVEATMNSQPVKLTSEIHDLKISQVITEVETTFQRNIILSQGWDRVLLNLSVQNFGDHLDTVFLKVTANGAPIQATFRAFEEVGLVQAISFQFEVPQTLVMTLNYTKQTQIQLEIIILLDYGVTLDEPFIDFLIQGAQLIALNLAHPMERHQIPLFNTNHHYQIQPVKYSFLKKDLFSSALLFVQIPVEMQLKLTVSVSLHGTKINSLTIDDQTFYPSENDFTINFNYTKAPTSIGQDLFLTMIISPDYEGLDGLTQIVLSTSVIGVLQPLSSFPIGNVLGSHPIPGIIMLPILLISLFGIPYYLVYQEHASDRDENILDPHKKTNL